MSKKPAKDHGTFTEVEYGMCEQFTEFRDQLKEVLLATALIVTLGLVMTVWKFFRAMAVKTKNSYKDFLLMGIGSVIWLIFLVKLWFTVQGNKYEDIKVVRKLFKGLVVLYVSLMLFLDGS